MSERDDGEESAEVDGADTDVTDADALLSRLQVIADQPLASRAEALGQVHDELRSRLESGDTVTRSDG